MDYFVRGSLKYGPMGGDSCAFVGEMRGWVCRGRGLGVVVGLLGDLLAGFL